MPQVELGLPIDSKTLQTVLPAEDFEIRDKGQKYFEFDATGFSLFLFALSWAAKVSADVVGKLIYDAVKKHSKEPPKRIMISKVHVEFDQEKITRAIQRQIKFMQLYIFPSTSIKNIELGIENNCWAVAPLDEPYETARRTRAADMRTGSAGLFYCSERRDQVFTTPFITESEPEDRAVTQPWADTWYLPFKIRPLSDLSRKVSWLHACKTWPFVRDSENRGGLVTPARAFAPEWIPRSEWDSILTELGVDPEAFEDLW